jgi:ABC-2 type transport system ATP-binding protein
VNVLLRLGFPDASLDGDTVLAVVPTAAPPVPAEDVVAALVKENVRVRGFVVEHETLEDRFVALTGEGFEVVR